MEMKRDERWARMAALLLAVASLWAGGCVYEAPLTEEHLLPIEPAVLGLWEYIPAADEKKSEPERMLVLRSSETEYLIHYPLGKGSMYFRAYPIRLGDFSGVQLQLLGSGDGPPEPGEKKLYHVAAYEMAAGELVIRTLNQAVVADDLKDPAGLRAAFLQHLGDKDLFNEPGRFRRVQEKE